MPEVTFDPITGKAVFNEIDRNDPANEAAFWEAHGGIIVAMTRPQPPKATSDDPDPPNEP